MDGINWTEVGRQWNYAEAIARIEVEFHWLVDECKVEEDALHSVWVFGQLRRWYPGVRAEVLNECIHRYGWH